MATNPYDQFDPPAQTTAPQYPGVIQGRPKAPAPRTSEQQTLDQLQIQKETLAIQEKQQEANAGMEAKAIEAERKAAAFLIRALGAEDAYTGTGVGAPSLIGQTARDAAPNIANYFTGEDRQTANSAQDEFIAASLRQDSGAAIPEEELERQRRIYFPMPGDGPDVIAQKRQARLRALAGLRQSAGRLEASAEERYNKLVQTELQQTTAAQGGVGPTDQGAIGYTPEGLQVTVTDDSPPPPPGGGSEFWQQIGLGTGDVVEGVGDIVGMVANPLNAGVNAALGTNLSTDMGQNLRDMSGLPQSGDNIYSTVNKFGAGALAGGGLARTMGQVMTPGTAQAVAQTLGRTPIRDTVAGAGAGAGSYVGRESGVPGGEYAGAILGGVAGYGASGAGMNALMPRQPNTVMRSANALGIDMMPADVGGTGTRFASSVVDRTLGAIPMAEGAARSVQSARNAVNKVSDNIGEFADPAGAGQAAQRGAKDFVAGSLARSEDLFERISVAPEMGVQLSETRSALLDITRGMQSNSALSRLWTGHPRLKATLEALTPKDVSADGRKAFMAASEDLTAAMERYDQLRNSVSSPAALSAAREQIDAAKIAVVRAQREAGREPVGGELSWQDMKRFRSIVGEIIGQPGLKRDGSDIAALRRLYGAITNDMGATAAQAGPKALTEWKRANQYFRGRQDRIDNVLTKVLGDKVPKADEAAFQQINRWAQTRGGDFKSLARTMRSMPADEASVVQATILQRMGLAKAGRQGAEGDDFSPAEFVTQWNNVSPRAKSILFPDKKHRESIDSLVTVMDSMKQAGQFTNASKTSIGTNIVATGAVGYANPAIGVLYALGQLGAGKLLASPSFARLLATTAKMPPQAANRRFTEQLGVLASKEPLIANDIQAVQTFLRDAVAQSPGRAAAENEANGGQPVPQQ